MNKVVQSLADISVENHQIINPSMRRLRDHLSSATGV
jgi:hypothetical protein